MSKRGWIVLIMVSLSLGQTMGKETDSETKGEVMKALEKTVHQFRQAMLENDLPELDRILSADYVGHNVYGGTEDRRAVLEAYQPGHVALHTFLVSEQHIELRGAVGIVRGSGNIAGTFQGQSFAHRVRFIDLFILESGVWRCFFSQSTEMVSQ